MGFLHSMTCTTSGIQSTAPVQWRGYDAICGVYWQAEGRAGATGYYRSPDPRVMLFFNDVSDHIGMSDQGAVDDPRLKPLLRAVFVPAGMPMWTRFRADHRFSHLDLHLRQNWLVERLAPALGAPVAAGLLMQPHQLQDVASVAAIGEALKQEVCGAPRHPVVAESLAVALVAAMLEPPHAASRHEGPSGGLTPAQMKRLDRLVEHDPGRRLPNADLAEAVGFSPSWFAHAFKKTTGKSPLQWQQERRIEMVKRALLSENAVIAEVSGQFGFADQAHFTRVFRQVTGTTPAAWLREVRSGRARPPQ
ncbi:helix-turn-helix domain-containing protein [Pseudogemmobacter sonorensis]|uniref:helix-turn-helix domain-containing protein n=1 Tax=Pseudogemmobacter sonorensis TaxID=2989681 RepID=UPI00368EC3E3